MTGGVDSRDDDVFGIIIGGGGEGGTGRGATVCEQDIEKR